MSNLDGAGARGPGFRSPSAAPARSARKAMAVRESAAGPALSRVGARAMAANKGLGFIWSELSTPGRFDLPSAGPMTPGFGQNLRSAWQGPSRKPVQPGVVPGGLQAFLGTSEEKKATVTGWKLDRSQQQFGFRPAVPGANPAPPRPMEPKGTPAPPGLPRPKALPAKEESPAASGPVQRSTDRLNQLMENSQRHMDRLLKEGGPGPTARQRLEARMAKARQARSQADEAAGLRRPGTPGPRDPRPSAAEQGFRDGLKAAQAGRPPAEPREPSRVEHGPPPRIVVAKLPPLPEPREESPKVPPRKPAVEVVRLELKAAPVRSSETGAPPRDPAPAPGRAETGTARPEPPRTPEVPKVEPARSPEPPKVERMRPERQAEAPEAAAAPVKADEPGLAEPVALAPKSAPAAEATRAVEIPKEAPQTPAPRHSPEPAEPQLAEQPKAEPSKPEPSRPEPSKPEPVRPAPDAKTTARPRPEPAPQAPPSPRPEPVAAREVPEPPARPAPAREEARTFGSVPMETPGPSPKPNFRARPQEQRSTAPVRDAQTQAPRHEERPEPRSTASTDPPPRRQPPARHIPPPLEIRRDRPPVEAPHPLKESESALEERAVRTRPSELTPIPEQPRRIVHEEPFRKTTRETARTHQEPEERGQEQSDEEEGEGHGQGQGRARKEEGVDRKRGPGEGQKSPQRSSTDPKEQQQQARRLTQTRESFQMALRKLEALQQTRASETVATRNAAQAIGALLKKAYREQELQGLDEESAVNALGLLLKIGGEQTYNHSARVLDLALGLADEISADLQTKKQTRQGALLKDLGDVGQVYRGQSDETLDELGGFLSRQDLRKASLLQDIGMLKVPREILSKGARLSVDEAHILRMHPVFGAEMVRPIASLRHLCPIIRGHHERWDGQGYPDGLKAEQIPLPARLIAIADAFDALRTHQRGLSPGEALAAVAEGAGTHFDPWLVGMFGRYVGRRFRLGG